MTFKVESGYLRDGIETITAVWVHPGEPRTGCYEKTTPIEETNDTAKYAELGITHLIERLTILEGP